MDNMQSKQWKIIVSRITTPRKFGSMCSTSTSVANTSMENWIILCHLAKVVDKNKVTRPLVSTVAAEEKSLATTLLSLKLINVESSSGLRSKGESHADEAYGLRRNPA